MMLGGHVILHVEGKSRRGGSGLTLGEAVVRFQIEADLTLALVEDAADPDRTRDDPLRQQPNGEPAPDPEAAGSPHTQLGTREGRNGKYPQSREFDEHGNPVRTVDHTDHGRPDIHDNPHQHMHTPNPTGGTPQHGPPEPLPIPPVLPDV